MTRPYKDEAVRISASSRVRPSGPRSSRTGSRWSLWLCSIFAAAGAAILVNFAGTGGSGANVPAAIQVGGQAAVITSGAAKSSVPKSNAGSTTNTSTTTTTSVTRHTTVIKPLSPVTDQEESKGYGNSTSDDHSGGDDYSGGTNVGTTTSTTTTIPSTSTTSTTLSTSVDN